MSFFFWDSDTFFCLTLMFFTPSWLLVPFYQWYCKKDMAHLCIINHFFQVIGQLQKISIQKKCAKYKYKREIHYYSRRFTCFSGIQKIIFTNSKYPTPRLANVPIIKNYDTKSINTYIIFITFCDISFVYLFYPTISDIKH